MTKFIWFTDVEINKYISRNDILKDAVIETIFIE